MTVAALTLLVQSALVAAGAQNYTTAYDEARASGKPLVVLVGADWCPACQTMKQAVIPSMQRGGKLAGVAFATVNTDRESAIARQLMQGGSIPQLVVYSKGATGWQRVQLTGAQSEAQVEAVLNQARQTQSQTATTEAASTKR